MWIKPKPCTKHTYGPLCLQRLSVCVLCVLIVFTFLTPTHLHLAAAANLPCATRNRPASLLYLPVRIENHKAEIGL